MEAIKSNKGTYALVVQFCSELAAYFYCTHCSCSPRSLKDARSLSRPQATLHSRMKKPPSQAEHFTVLKSAKLPFTPELLKCIGLDDQKNYLCNVCKKSFTGRRAGIRHLSIHLGQHMFTCPVPVCSRKFSSPTEIIAHFNQHPGSQTSALEDATEIFEYIDHYLLKGERVPTWDPNTDPHFTTENDPGKDRKIFKCKLCQHKIFSESLTGLKQ